MEFCGAIPGSAEPCSDSQYWPLSLSSSSRPFTVHYPRQNRADTAVEMVRLLEESWTIQIDTIGFAAPLSDGGACGPDGNLDVFIWPGIGGAYVADVAANPLTPYEDVSTYMAFDPSGSSGGALLNTFMAHEFNHVVQASDDWAESAQHYEAGATFAEALVYPDDTDWYFEMADFQDNPQWSLFYDDFGATWYTYAAAMYLHYLYEKLYPGDPGFYARIWRATRSDVGADRPDYFDALRAVLLNERGVTLEDTVAEFMQWRWFVAANDDGNHYSRGADWPYTVAARDVVASDELDVQVLAAMPYGANYFRVSNGLTVTKTFTANIVSSDIDVSWRLIDVATSTVSAPITLLPGEDIVLVAVVLPIEEVWTGNLSFDEKSATLELDFSN
jgi:hypothetical protein